MSFYHFAEKDPRQAMLIGICHEDDQACKDAIERKFGHPFINQSVSDGDIDTDVSAAYIKKLIQSYFCKDTSKLVVLVSNKTKCRKHVDLEISAAPSKKVGGCSRLAGILGLSFTLTSDGKYFYENMPARLADNIKSDDAKMYRWSHAGALESSIRDVIEVAFNTKDSRSEKTEKSRVQMQRETCE